MKKLTNSQYIIYSYYKKYIEVNNKYPTYRQASKDLDISQSVIHGQVKRMEKMGINFKHKVDEDLPLPQEMHITLLEKILVELSSINNKLK